jgi:hypothetical protein
MYIYIYNNTLIIETSIINSFLLCGFLVNKLSVGGSVARANDAKVSIIRLTHNN